MKILIVEDDPFVAEDIRDKVEALGYQTTGIAESYEEALKAVSDERPDIVLLDIELKGPLSGIDFSVELAGMNLPFIYLSNKQDLSTYLLAKSTNPVRNLPKPINSLMLRNVLDEAFSSLQVGRPAGSGRLIGSDNLVVTDENVLFFVPGKEGKRIRIQPDEIIYIQAGRSYCDLFFTNGDRITAASPMGAVVKKIGQKNMVRIHRSYYINLNHVKSRDGNQLYMIIGEALPISEGYKEHFLRYSVSL